MIKIKGIIKVLTLSFILLTIGLLTTNDVYASKDSKVKKQSEVEVIITNDETGKETIINPKDLTDGLEVSTYESSTDSMEKGYDIFIPIDELPDDLISPFAENGASKKSGGVTARLYVDYNWTSTGRLRINKVRGSWSPSANMYKVTNRKVNAHNGGLPGMGLRKLAETPTKNSFSYITGWGYQSVATGDHGAMAESIAKIKISGMTSTHTINLRLFVP